jgi:hypothetical protein
MAARYELRFFFDWAAETPLWAGNDAAYDAFDVGPLDLAQLGLSEPTIAEGKRLALWHDIARNPEEPEPWTAVEADRFNHAARAWLEVVRRELGPDFDIVDRFLPVYEGLRV